MTARPARSKRPWMLCGCLVLILFLAVSTIVGIRTYVALRMRPEDRRTIARYESEIISLPGDWHKPATLPPLSVVAFRQRFDTTMEELNTSYSESLYGTATADGILSYYPDDILTEDQQTSFSFLLTKLQPLIDDTSHTVRLAGYTPDVDLYAERMMNFLNYQTFAKLMSLRARQLARQDNCLPAMETAALPLRMVTRPAQSYETTHIISIAILWHSIKALYDISKYCTDVAALQLGLDLLTALRDGVFPGEVKNWVHKDPLVALRWAAAHGYPVDISPQPLADYYRQTDTMSGTRYYEWIVDNLPPSDLRTSIAKQRITRHTQWNQMAKASGYPESPGPTSWKEKLQGLVTGVDPVTSKTIPYAAYEEELTTRATSAIARYDLTRIHFARRIAESDSSAADFTAYLTPIPSDPFTSTPFRFSNRLNKHYSVGPDIVDDKAAVLYDVTNGTVSAGDVWMDAR